ncbi:hypothetical protein [Cyanothece sp. BG0011]|uniref:hypothetical protein n=1 Tax=Cyanothece sp. BG0011 TaxID=2082950 RepID=UPI000D1F0912|nr:hypothetical protein [Cyanothece sp. BG0011]
MAHQNRYVKALPNSPYAYGAKANNAITSAYYESARSYMNRRFIGRSTLRLFVRKGWLAIFRVKGRLWVHEVCSEEIEDYLY